jgi:hypothetical protein
MTTLQTLTKEPILYLPRDWIVIHRNHRDHFTYDVHSKRRLVCARRIRRLFLATPGIIFVSEFVNRTHFCHLTKKVDDGYSDLDNPLSQTF